ncbi:MAG: SDR family oxidoreductase [Acidobacteria bacterium]|nr:SDR family oxidoreductase [Acidobacteriota bacterium]
MSLENHVAFMPGATGGLGRAVTQAFLSQGATVVVPLHTPAAFQQLVERAGAAAERLVGIQADLTNPASAQQAVEAALHKAGRIDSLVNLVGGYAGGKSVAETEDKVWNRMLALNLSSAFWLSRAVLPHMLERNQGRILHIASRAAVEPFASACAYIASKAGLVALTRAIAVEVAGRGITANVILPGTLDTAANRQSMPKADFSEWVRPESLAHTILFLVSDQAQEINGALIPVYGGS